MALTSDYSALSFDGIKTKIIDVLKNSEEFKDYDFTGARLNVLADQLAYTALYDSAYANAAVFESWNQYARTREAVVAHAQGQGYTPASKRAATIDATLVLKYTGQAATYPSVAIVPRGYKIFGTSGNKTYEFVTIENYELYGSVNTFSGPISLAQGRFLQNLYTVTNTANRFIIKDPNIDRRFIRVTIDGAEWSLAENMARAEGTAPVYYIRETVEGWTEVYFGTGEFTPIDGQVDLSMYVGGLKPVVGSKIEVEYLVTAGGDANFITSFKAVDSVANFTVFDLTFNEGDYSAGGSEREDMERIRTLAPKMNEAQGRCVTATDYESFVRKEFGGIISSIKCWTEPGKTGYAYIAIKPTDGLALSPSQITAITEYLKKYNVIVVTPKIVRPIYVFVNHTIEVDFDPNALEISEQQLRANIMSSINTYYTQNITTFNSGFHSSKLMRYIDDTHKAILGSQTDIDIVKEFSIEMFWDLSGGSYMGDAMPLRGLSTFPFTWNEIDDELVTVRTAELVIDSTDGGDLVIGPFPSASAAYLGVLYTGSDFNSKINNGDNWYVVGSVNYSSGIFTLTDFDDLPSYRFTKESIDEESIRFKGIIAEADLYPANGEIIAYEPDIRPEYITITFTPVTSV